jgi:hypothetical protein
MFDYRATDPYEQWMTRSHIAALLKLSQTYLG